MVPSCIGPIAIPLDYTGAVERKDLLANSWSSVLDCTGKLHSGEGTPVSLCYNSTTRGASSECLTRDTAESLAHAFVTSSLGYCNTLLVYQQPYCGNSGVSIR